MARSARPSLPLRLGWARFQGALQSPRLPNISAPPLPACLSLWNKLPGGGHGTAARLHRDHGNASACKTETQLQDSIEPYLGGTGPASSRCLHAVTHRLGGWRGESLRGVLHPPRPLPTPRSGLFAFKGNAQRKAVGRAGHAFPPWRLGHTPANRAADTPPCGCRVRGEGVWGSCPEPGEGEPVQ